jgi:hypothetical protein
MEITVEKGKKEKEAKATAPAQTAEAKPKAQNEDAKKIHAFLVQKGKDGAQASDIAMHLGWIEKDADPKSPEFKAACKKVRKLARDVVDNTDGGSRTVRNGRQKVYQILA